MVDATGLVWPGFGVGGQDDATPDGGSGCRRHARGAGRLRRPAPEAARPGGGQAATASHAWTVEAFEVSAEDARSLYLVKLPVWVGR
jgi:hypothetical protein